MTHWQGLNLKQQVAQRLVVGFSGLDELALWAETPPAGLIAFSHNVQALPGGFSGVQAWAAACHQAFAGLPTLGPLWLGVDQEGGPVERLAYHQFPSVPSPWALGAAFLEETPAIIDEAASLLAQSLALAGFNLNFAPTLDVNLESSNPIIGVRAFGATPKRVWSAAHQVLQAHKKAGVLPVVKHFPGHGSGVVDSHEALPTLVFSPEERWAFEQAIAWGAPAVLVAHGYYPQLQAGDETKPQPCTLSKAVLQGLLREQLGFNGVIFTDDMAMGAIAKAGDPLEVAIQALAAGCDVLLYRDSGPLTFAVLDGITAALEEGWLDLTQHQQALGRIKHLKTQWPQPVLSENKPVSFAELEKKANALAQATLTVEKAQNFQPFCRQKTLWLLMPPRSSCHHYAADALTSPELEELLTQQGFEDVRPLFYQTPQEEMALADRLMSELLTQQVLVVSRLPHQGLVLLNALEKIPLATALNWAHACQGLPASEFSLNTPWVSVTYGLYSFHPPAMGALAAALALPLA